MSTPRSYGVLGSDLALTAYSGVPSTVELGTADSWGELDLRVRPGGQGGRPQAGDVQDLAIASGRENLGQALMLRLLTMKGALAPLGHPQYGSRIPSLVGQLNDARTRNLARLYTIEAVGEEPRVKALTRLVVEPVDGYPDTIRIAFDVVLGHPPSGSRIPSLVGQLNDARTRNLARLYTIEAVGEEPRVKALTRLVVEPVDGYPDTIRIAFDVVPAGDEDAIDVSLDVTL